MGDASAGLRRLLERLFAGRPVEWVETHISIVALLDEQAFKFKKAVDLGFLDFSTLEQRQHFCEEELRLNRRLAPELYLGLVRVSGSPDSPGLDGPGPTLEYGVRMRRFDREQELRAVVARDEADARLFEKFARTLVDFHTTAARANVGDEFGTIEVVGDALRENFAHLTDGRFDEELLERIRSWVDSELECLREVLPRRKLQGAIRECHGDLHLGNLVLHEGRILPFDCLEFSGRLRWIDTSAEVAFLSMDLDHRGRRDLAFAFLNGYFEAGGDYDGLRPLRLHLVARALVRAKVAAIEHSEVGDADVRAHLELARRYLAPTHPPTLWLTFGLSGSGKTTIGRMAARQLPAFQIRSDVVRAQLVGAGTEDPYSPEMTRRTYERLESIARVAIGCGWSAILDATYLRQAQRQEARRLAEALGVELRILAVGAETSVLRERVERRRAAGEDASEATLEILQGQLEHHEPLTDREQASAVKVDTSEGIDEQQLRALIVREDRGWG